MAKTKLEQITKVDEQIRQLENQKKRLVQEHKNQERKSRTKRLIERGAILESVIDDPESLTNEQIKQYLEKTLATDSSRRILISLKGRAAEAVTEKSAELPQGSEAVTAAKVPETARRVG